MTVIERTCKHCGDQIVRCQGTWIDAFDPTDLESWEGCLANDRGPHEPTFFGDLDPDTD